MVEHSYEKIKENEVLNPCPNSLRFETLLTSKEAHKNFKEVRKEEEKESSDEEKEENPVWLDKCDKEEFRFESKVIIYDRKELGGLKAERIEGFVKKSAHEFRSEDLGEGVFNWEEDVDRLVLCWKDRAKLKDLIDIKDCKESRTKVSTRQSRDCT